MKPVVDRLEEELKDKLVVIRVNVQEDAGRSLAHSLGFEYTPTFILFDAQGQELWRQVGALDLQRVRESANE
jgi:hypothetical protein